MYKRILLGVDASFSPVTQYALNGASKALAESSSPPSIVLINVVPRPFVAIATLGVLFVKSLYPLPITIEQRIQAENALWRAHQELQEQGIAPEKIETLIREGNIVEEILIAANELQVDCIVVGAKENSLKQKIQHFFSESTSHLLSQYAPCPVMIVVSPRH